MGAELSQATGGARARTVPTAVENSNPVLTFTPSQRDAYFVEAHGFADRNGAEENYGWLKKRLDQSGMVRWLRTVRDIRGKAASRSRICLSTERQDGSSVPPAMRWANGMIFYNRHTPHAMLGGQKPGSLYREWLPVSGP